MDVAEKGRRARRLPTRQQLAVWRAFIETAETIRSTTSVPLQATAGLSVGDYQVLLALSEAEGRCLRSSELAAGIGWERSRLSHHLGRMEKRGLISRQECKTDNRGAEVHLTEQGDKAFRKGSRPHLECIREQFVDVLTDEQLDQLAVITSRLGAALEAGSAK